MDKLIQILTPLFIALFVKPAETIMIVLLLVTCDFLLGLLASKKKNRGFSWKKAWDTPIKFLVYAVAVFIAAGIEYRWLPKFPCVNTAASMIAYLELRSADRHMKALTGYSFFENIINLVKPKDKDNGTENQ